MKNRGKDAKKKSKRYTLNEKLFSTAVNYAEKIFLNCKKGERRQFFESAGGHFCWYKTSFTSFTVLETSGNAAATRFGA
jgi:hypothetical protein